MMLRCTIVIAMHGATYLEHRARSKRASDDVGDSPRSCNISNLRLPPVRPLRFGIWNGMGKLVGPCPCRGGRAVETAKKTLTKTMRAKHSLRTMTGPIPGGPWDAIASLDDVFLVPQFYFVPGGASSLLLVSVRFFGVAQCCSLCAGSARGVDGRWLGAARGVGSVGMRAFLVWAALASAKWRAAVLAGKLGGLTRFRR